MAAKAREAGKQSGRALAALIVLGVLGLVSGVLLAGSARATDPTTSSDTTTTASSDDPGSPASSSQYIVKFARAVSADDQLATLDSLGATSLSYVAPLRLRTVEMTAEAAAELEAGSLVERVEADRTRDVSGTPDDPGYGDQWSLGRIGWDELYGSVEPGGSATVAVLDTGVSASHPDLEGQLVAGTDILGGGDGTTDPNGHGTAMAGIVAAATNNGKGIAGIGYAGVRVMPVRVLGADGTGQDSDIIAGVVYAADHGADVILMSFSNPGFSASLQDAIDYAWDQGAVLVAAAGNEGSGTATFPAGDRGVMGVSSTDANDARATSSSYGPAAFIAAPGEGIATLSTDGGITTVSGTSAAAAEVAGAAALLKAASDVANGVIVSRLARNAAAAGTADELGNGRLDLARAMADDSTESIQPAGAGPLGDGGPFVGPYVISAITLTPASGPAGQSVSVSGGGWSNGGGSRTATVLWDGAATADSCSVNNGGNLQGSCGITVPAVAPAGPHEVRLTVPGDTANDQSATFTVTLGTATTVSSITPGAVVAGNSTTVAVTVTTAEEGGQAPNGSVTVSGTGGLTGCTIAAAAVTWNLSGGSYTGTGSCAVSATSTTSQASAITAVYGGDTNAYATSTSAASPLYINPKLAFSSAALNAPAGSCSALTVQFRNGNNSGSSVASSTTVSLSTASAGGAFYSNSGCTAPTTQVTVSSGQSTNGAGTVFYRDTVVGNPVLTASAGSPAPAGSPFGALSTSAAQTETITFGACSSTGSTSWSSASTWNCGRVPLATDDVTISSGDAVTIPASFAAAARSVTFGADSSSRSLALLAGTSSLSVGGNVVVNQPTSNSNNAQLIVDAGTVSVSGNLSLNTTSTTSSRCDRVRITTGTLSVAGDLILSNPNSGTNGCTTTGGFGAPAAMTQIDMSGGAGTLNLSGALTLAFPSLATAGLASNAGSLVNFEGTAAQTIPMPASAAWTYSDVHTNNSSANGATLGAAVAATKVTGNLRVLSGKLGSGSFAITGAATKTFEVANGATFKTTTGTTAAFPSGFSTATLGATSTVEYALNGAQTISARSYGHLTLSGGNTKTAGGSFSIAGDFTNSGVTFDGSGSTATFTGGAAIQTIQGTSPTTFAGLTVDKSAGGVTLAKDATVAGTLALTSGVVATGANTLTAEGAVTRSASLTSNFVQGNLRKPVATGSSTPTFEVGTGSTYSPIALSIGGASAGGTLTASTTGSQHSSHATSGISSTRYVNRHWKLTAGGGLTVASYAATFTFANPQDLVGGPNTSALAVRRFDGAGWHAPSSSSSTSTTATGSGFTQFGEYAAGESAALDHFDLAAPAGATAGSPFGVVVTAIDADGATMVSYTGTIHFAGTDGQAVLPSDFTFAAGDQGSKSFTSGVTLKTAGSQAITVNDTVQTAKTGIATVSVTHAAAASLVLSGSTASLTEGASRSYTATMKDAYGNTVESFGGTVGVVRTAGAGVLVGLGNATASNGVATKMLTAQRPGSVTIQASSASPAFDSNTLTFTIDNVAPTVTLTGQPSANEGETKSFSFSLTDTGTGETFSVDSQSCGAGNTLSNPSFNSSTGAGSFDCYFADGPSTPSVSVAISDGTDSGTASKTVTVANVAPTVNLTGADSVSEGSTHTYTYTVTDPGDDEFEVVAGFPTCGANGELVSGSDSTTPTGGQFDCFFADGPASTDVRIKVKDSDGATALGSADVVIVAIANVDPTITPAAEQFSDEGEAHTFSLGSFTDEGADDAPWHVSVDWGDGSTADEYDLIVRGSLGSIAHSYADGPNTYPVEITVTDKNGGSDTQGFTATVNNVSPTALLSNDGPVDEASPVTASFSSQFDPSTADAASLHYAFSCLGADLTGTTYGDAGTSDSASCAFDDDGLYDVTGIVIDRDGGFNTYTTQVQVDNVAPTTDLSSYGPVDEGSPATIGFSNQFDPSTADTNAGFHYAYSCTNGNLGGATYANTAGSSDSTQCTFDDGPGTYTVKARILDKDGGFGEYTTSVTVNNVAPTADLGSGGAVDEGSPATVSFANQFDPSSADTTAGFRYEYHCDGSLFGSPADYASASPSATHQCTFADNGSYTVRARIIDKDDGATAYTTSVTVNNVAPTVTAAANQASDEGASVSFGLGSFSDPGVNDDPWDASVDWGDGTPTTDFSTSAQGLLDATSHAYADNDTYTVTVTVTDRDGDSGSDTFTVTVSNVDPTVTAAADQDADEGTPASIDLGSFSDPGANDDPWAVSVDWGDLTSSDNFDTSGQGPLGTRDHTYADDGIYTVEVIVTDKDGGTDSATFTVTVANLAPVVTAADDQSSAEGQSHLFDLGSFTDAGLGDGDWTVDVDWGDSSSSSFTTATQNTIPATSHSYADNGNYTVTVTVTDKDNDSGDASFTATVNNLPPTVVLTGDTTADEGTTHGYTFSVSDPGVNDTFTVDAGYPDCGLNGTYVTGSLTTTASGGTFECSFADGPKQTTVKIRVSDNDGAQDVDTQNVQIVEVANLAPEYLAPNDQASVEGELHSFLLGSFSDAGVNDGPWAVDVSWDDGQTESFTTGSQSIPATAHTYADNGPYSVNVTVTDKDGGFASASFLVTVSNANPVVTSAADQSSSEGESHLFSLGEFSDAGLLDGPWGATVNWGDGSPDTTFDSTSQGPLAMTSHTYDDEGTGPYTVSVTVTDKDSGSDTATFDVTVSNLAPVVTAAADQSSNEGEAKSFGLGSFTDAGVNDDPWQVDVDWGDSSSDSFSTNDQGSLGSLFHTYADNDTYTVTVAVTDEDGASHSDTFDVTVSNVAPTVTVAADQIADEGTSASIELGSFSDPGVDDSPWQVLVNWGDSSSDSFATGFQGSLGSLGHTYADNGTYTVTVKVTDKDAAFDMKTFEVEVANLAPSVTSGGDQTSYEGESYPFALGSFSDAGLGDGDWAVDVDWGDSTAHTTFDPVAPGSLGSKLHTYADNDTYTVTVTVTDKDDDSGTATFDVTVANLPPVVVLTGDAMADEGTTHTYSYTVSDPGVNDTFTVDGGYPACGAYGEYVSGSLSSSPTGDSGSFDCSFADGPKSTSVAIKVSDNDGLSDSGTQNVQIVDVQNLAPEYTAAADGQTADEGESLTFDLGSFTDAGVDDGPWTIDVDWGDGGMDSFQMTAQGTIDPTAHAYADEGLGLYVVTVTVTDKDGGVDAASFSVNVNNVAPAVTAASDQTADEGASTSFDLGSFTDPGTLDGPWAVSVDWGDGSPVGSYSASAPGTLDQQSHTHADNGTYTVEVTVTDNDGDSDTDSFDVVVANVDPAATFVAQADVGEGSSFLLSLDSVVDPGLDTFEYRFDCGDGTLGAWGASNTASCPTSDDAVLIVRGQVRDDDGGLSEIYEATTTVHNVDPAATFVAQADVGEGSSFLLSLDSVVDPGLDTFEYRFDCGDGTLGAWGASNTASCPTSDDAVLIVRGQVRDDDGGLSEIYEATTTVHNVAPTVLAAANQFASEGTSESFDLGSFSDPGVDDDPWSVDVDWGDGSLETLPSTNLQGGLGAASHTYADNGTYTVWVTVTDNDNGYDAASFGVTVANVDPTATFNAPSDVDEGSNIELSLTDPDDPGADMLSYEFDCGTGDGYQPSLTNTATCPTDDNGSRTVKGRISDEDGGSSESTATVTIDNVAPTATLSGATASEGSPATVSFSDQSDPSLADTSAGFHYAYACDDGDLSGATYGSSGANDSTTCTYPDDGTYTVKARIIDKDNGYSEYTATVTVTNVAPVVTPAANQNADEGASTAFSLGSFTDPGADSPWAVSVDWGDTTPASTTSAATAGSLGTLSHTYADGPNDYTVSVTVSDGDGGSDTKSFSVHVNNVAPTVMMTGATTADEGTTETYTFTVSDPGVLDTFTIDAGYPSCGLNGNLISGSLNVTASGGTFDCEFPDGPANTNVAIKVRDSDGGSDLISEQVQIVPVSNVAPLYTAATAQGSNEGEFHSFDLGSFTDDGAFDAPWTIDVDWGDGSPVESFPLTSRGTIPATLHTYAQDGSYTVEVTVTDKDNDFDSATFGVAVANLAPVVTADADQSSDEGEAHSFDLGSFSDAGVDDGPWAVSVDWGDGNIESRPAPAVQGPLGSAIHTYADSGGYTVTVTVSDEDSASGDASFTATVANVKPTATFNAPAGVNEGSDIVLSLTGASDASPVDAASLTFAFDCGSGYGAASPTSTATCPTNDDGSRTVKGKVIDKDGGATEYTAGVTIGNAAPTATFNAPASVNEGSNIALSLTSPFDPSSVDTAAGFTYAFDCGSGTYGPAGASSMATCPTNDDGSRTVRGKILDKDGGATEYTAGVMIDNVAPTAALTGGSANEGSPATVAFSGQFDPSSVDATNLRYAFDCYGGAISAAYATAGTGASTTCTRADNGTYPVTGRILDKDGGYTDYTTNITVSNVAPVVTAAANQTANEGSSTSFSLGSFGDVGVTDNPWTADVSWGDAGSQSFMLGSQGSLGSLSHTYADNGTYTVTVKVTDKDLGYDSKTFQVTVANVAPTATLTNNGPKANGQAATISFTSPSDPSSADTSAGLRYAFDCSGAAITATYATSTTIAPTTCTFTDGPSMHTVSGRILDKDGGYTDYTTTLQVIAGPAAALRFAQQPTDAVTGTAIAPPATVQITDLYGSSKTLSGVNVTIELTPGTFPAGATLSGTLTRTTDANGLATFDDLKIDTAAGGYQLRASSPTYPASLPQYPGYVDSDPFGITPGTVLSDVADYDVDLSKGAIDGVDVLFGDGASGNGTACGLAIDKKCKKITNTNPSSFRWRLTLQNETGLELHDKNLPINAQNGGSIEAFLTIPALPKDVGWGTNVNLPAAAQPYTSSSSSAFITKGSNPVHVKHPDKSDGDPDLLFRIRYTTSLPAGTADCSQLPLSNGAWMDGQPGDGVKVKCIYVTGFELKKHGKAKFEVNLEWALKGVDGWQTTAQNLFRAGFPFKSTAKVTLDSNFGYDKKGRETPLRGLAGQPYSGNQAIGLVLTGKKVTAVGGFLFDQNGGGIAGAQVVLHPSAIGANCASSSLVSSITDGQTTFAVSSATGFPTTNGFYVSIDQEQLWVKGGAGTTTWTVDRGKGGSTKAAHAAGAAVNQGMALDTTDDEGFYFIANPGDNTGQVTTANDFASGIQYYAMVCNVAGLPAENHPARPIDHKLGDKEFGQEDFYISPTWKVVFSKQPANTKANANFTVSVQLVDFFGQPVTRDNVTTAKLDLNANPGGGTLTCTAPNTVGTNTAVVVGGAVTFTCKVSAFANSYQLLTSSPSNASLKTSTSNFFNITK